MIRSYFIVGIRNLLKQKGYSAIKILGLAFGLAASLVIYLFVKEDLSYDAFHKNYKHIVRVLTIDSAEGVSSKLVGVSQMALGPAVETSLPEVLRSVRVVGGGPYDLSYEDNALKCEAAFRTESSFFEIFDFEVAEGKREKILDQPGDIAITWSLARKIFGEESAIGKTLRLNQTTELHIVTVLEDLPKNSHLQFDLLRSLTPGENEQGLQQALQSWQGINSFTYLWLDEGVDQEELITKIQEIARENNAFEFFTPVVQPLADIHLHSKDVLFETNANKSDVLNVYVLSVIAILIILLAAVNFMNLVTAKSAGRAKEVGIRKVIGAVRKQLIGQYLSESLLITLLSALLAFAVVYSVVPLLNNEYQRFANVSELLSIETLGFVVLLVAIVGLFSGLYPAFVLSSYQPTEVLKGGFKSITKGIRLREVLVVLQFTISIALMVGTGIVYQQMTFIYSKDLGYSRDQLVTIQQSGAAIRNTESLRTELLRNPNITSVGSASSRLGQQLGRTRILPEGYSQDDNFITSVMQADVHFIPTMEMEIISGRNFSLDFDDSLSIIVNEELTRLLKWDDAVGKIINQQTGPNPEDLTGYTIIGVVKDFHFATIRHKLEPMFMFYNPSNNALAIKVSADNIHQSIAYIEDTWKKINPGTTFEYNFLDEQFANLYRNEKAFSKMFSHFTLLAIFIAGLGLFALSAFTAEQRKKEIGIRKVLGASNGNILFILSSEFIRLILIAFVLASGAAYLVMSNWLRDFQYRIDIGFEVFLLAGLLSIGIALFTVSFQALKAAFSNPVNSIRSE